MDKNVLFRRVLVIVGSLACKEKAGTYRDRIFHSKGLGRSVSLSIVRLQKYFIIFCFLNA
jgi:hypothetical protein